MKREGGPSRRADQGCDYGAAEIQRITENAPLWPDLTALCRRAVAALTGPMRHGRRAACHVLSWSGWIDFRTIRVCPKDLARCDAGFRGFDLDGAVAEKRAYNAEREDHKPENRRKEGGKAF